MLRPQMPYQHYYRWNPKGFLSLFPKEVYESFSGRGNPTLTPHPTGRAWRRCSMKHFLHIVICCFFCYLLQLEAAFWRLDGSVGVFGSRHLGPFAVKRNRFSSWSFSVEANM